jgi:ribonuclease P protein component
MLPKRHRLKSRTDLLRVRRYGRPFRHPLAILLVIEAAQASSPEKENAQLKDLPPSRFAFSASRRVGSAVARNRGKRLLREAVRLQLDHINPGWDCLVIVRETTPESDFAAVKTAVDTLLSRACLVSVPSPG